MEFHRRTVRQHVRLREWAAAGSRIGGTTAFVCFVRCSSRSCPVRLTCRVHPFAPTCLARACLLQPVAVSAPTIVAQFHNVCAHWVIFVKLSFSYCQGFLLGHAIECCCCSVGCRPPAQRSCCVAADFSFVARYPTSPFSSGRCFASRKYKMDRRSGQRQCVCVEDAFPKP